MNCFIYLHNGVFAAIVTDIPNNEAEQPEKHAPGCPTSQANSKANGTTYDELCASGNIPVSFQSDNFKEAWGNWLAYRREKRQGIKLTTATKQIKMLVSLGKALAIESIDQSIRNGYIGLFDVKKNGQVQQPIDYSKRDEIDRKNREAALQI